MFPPIHLSCPIFLFGQFTSIIPFHIKTYIFRWLLIFLILKTPNITHGFTILCGLLIFLILNIPNIINRSTILYGPFIFLIFMFKPKKDNKIESKGE